MNDSLISVSTIFARGGICGVFLHATAVVEKALLAVLSILGLCG